ncbi:pyruvate:ferredoxin (flavodoxin) oxidoreductase [Clostridium sp. D2Q-11]|uniref:Pyruvate:ferredoxin (Flavodoxin) oxidoreductase n=1 Tax=Anaeromonas frigoriresistens TaxID=2683708 RepID=A0A942Z9V0_9FIRM|nr:pyruvate:ferredoxin (flavodoxin) oxidoreductase [Anaeromonas frigoriresistens]MBS4539210.1 pyruvate:ferredoxin (flavodoxin) oxidoreductase [Anaeromonas frigoriresistens]
MERNMRTMDGNEAAAYVSYAFTEVAAIYPITPSSPMAEKVDLFSAHGKKNMFGQEVKVIEMQSEAGAAGTFHGSLQGGALTTTYTASQGLLLMIPNMYKVAGELLPGVFHVSARALATHALSIFGDHQDVMATRQTGFALLAAGSVQEVMDLSGIAHMASIESRIPFLHFFDGFRTSHEVQKIEVIDYDVFDKLVNHKKIDEFRKNSLNPERPVMRGTAQNPDIYFQGRESSNQFYDRVPDIVEEYMGKLSKEIGREYHPFDYYGAEDAERVIVAMGSVCEAIEETIDYLLEKGEKVGLIKVRLYRPFSIKYFLNVLPKSVGKIAVLDRTKEAGSIAEPLHEDILSLFYEKENRPLIVGGRYGLGSKDTTPSQILSVYENLKSENPRNDFTIGIIDDISNKSLEPIKIDLSDKDTVSCKLWGLGSDGTVGANKMAIKIIGNKTDNYAQGYFSYDSKKSGGTTISHLRFSKNKIRSTYLVSDADYIACHNKSFVYHYDLLNGLKKNGKFVLNCPWDEAELDEKLPAPLKSYIANNDIDFYIIDAVKIAGEVGLGGRINMIMQSVFFKLVEVLPMEKAIEYLKDEIYKTYGKKGEKIVQMNYDALDKGYKELIKVIIPKEWKALEGGPLETHMKRDNKFVEEIQISMARHEGDDLPVSAFKDMEDGTFPMGTTAYEKRGIAVLVPEWQTDKCIQCNRCSYVCPHAVIRPFLLNKSEKENVPDDTFETKIAVGKGLEDYEYRIQISPLDCTGCGNCADICPAPGKALVMVEAEKEIPRQVGNWEYAINNVKMKENPMKKETVKGSQFEKPLLEFHGACAGCGETAYVKLITQLFGERMLIANATGCSSIWGASAPSMAYTTKDGKGPAWANSLFEDNAEFGLGIYLGTEQIRSRLKKLMENKVSENTISSELKTIITQWIEKYDNGEESIEVSQELVKALEQVKEGNSYAREILNNKEFLTKKSQWIIGGDGWAYDIGYGGLDHVIASGEDVNILVFDTEVYSNTGGQASKATPTASAAKFAAAGKKIRKKNLGLMAMSYGYVYVAQVALGANMNHTIKAIVEAEKYKGPSVIICYAPCVSHGIKNGMGVSVNREKEAVDSGYWHLYRYNPDLETSGQNPFVLDSKEPRESFREFIMNEIRFSQIQTTFPEIAEDLYSKAEDDAMKTYKHYKRLADMDYSK